MPLRAKNKTQAGFAALLATLIVMAIILVVVAGLSATTLIEQKISANTIHSAQAYYAAESGIEDSLYRLIRGHSYLATNNFTIGSSTVAITISDEASIKNILARGQKNERYRSLRTKLSIGGQSASFYYGVQVGEGGLVMDNNSRIEGSLYSNGPIQGSQGATITGDAWVANSALAAKQQSTANNSDLILGQADPAIDGAQGFTPATSENLLKISLLLKKSGSPTNKTVRLLTDDNDHPSKNLASAGSYGTLFTQQVSASAYSWVDISLNAPVALQAGAKYWITLDSSLDEDNYLSWGKDSDNNYAGGSGQYSQNWNAASPVWSDTGGDLAFKAWFGQANNALDKISVGANAHANTIKNSAVTGHAYYQTLTNTTVGGTKHPGSADPAAETMPIPQSTIDGWKNEATAGGTTEGDYIVDAGAIKTLGPQKITGNLTISNGGDLTISGTLYVVGNINIFNNAKIRLSASFGNFSGAIITDGAVNVANGCVFYGNGSNYILLLTTKAGEAVSLANNSDTAIFYAPNGIIDVNNNTTLKELTGYQIHLNNGAQVVYESGLASLLFSSGVSGSWEVNSWEEVP